MRPRHKAAENADDNYYLASKEALASMRPRHKAAENAREAADVTAHMYASMRPRHKAAENPLPRCVPGCRRARFNEAAA